MLLVLVVLIILIMIINVVNRINTNDSADEIINVIYQSETSGKLSLGNTSPSADLESTTYSTRYFYILVDEETGTIYPPYTTGLDAETATEVFENAQKTNKTKGYIDKYRFMTQSGVTAESGDGVADILCTMYIFLDWESELSSWTYFLWISIGISVLAYIVIYIAMYFISLRVVRPIAESYEKQKSFITDAGHDLKTPLTIINADTEVIEMTEGESEWTQSIKEQVERLTSLTNKLIYLAKMDEREERMNFSKFDISRVVADVCEDFIPLAHASGKELTLSIKPELIYNGDEDSIKQLVTLLVDNAFKYANEGGEISVTLQGVSNRYVTLSVYNTVDEIKPGRHDELFNRFYRTDNSRNSQTGGQGIGLSVVQAIVNVHKGRVRCESNDNKSIVFYISL